MKKLLFLLSFLLIICMAKSDISVVVFWGEGCPHCERMMSLLETLSKNYSLNVSYYEVYYHPENSKELNKVFDSYSLPNNMRGVPVLLIGNALVIGEVSKDRLKWVIETCGVKSCDKTIVTENSIYKVNTDANTKKKSENLFSYMLILFPISLILIVVFVLLKNR